MSDLKAKLSRAFSWAEDNQRADSLAETYLHLCAAIHFSDGDNLTESRLFATLSEKEQDDGIINFACDDLDALHDRIMDTRNTLAGVICDILDKA